MVTESREETIVSIASGLSGGAIAVIRLSGKDCFVIASKFLRPAFVFPCPKPNMAYLLKVFDDNKLIDRVIAVAYIAPKSFTGENMLEIFCHASPYITRRIINLALKNSARQALPGEFSMRAFLNNKMDLAQAEALNDLILSETECEHSAAIKQTEGSLGKMVRSFRKTLLDLLSELEVRIDDSYEETPELDRNAFLTTSGKLKKKLKNLSDGFYSGKYVKNGIRVALVGAPNSGKSSLLNAILGFERAIVSPMPGTTRDTVEEKLELNGFKVIFTDTAGINPFNRDPIEKEGMERTAQAIRKSDIVLLLEDFSRPRSKIDEMVKKTVKENLQKSCQVIRIRSKSDLPSRRGKAKGFLSVSSITGEGIEKLKTAVVRKEIRETYSSSGEIITSARHFTCLKKTWENLEKAEKTLLDGKGGWLELAAENLRMALSALSDIVGETTNEDLLNNIFSNFCVGK